MIEEKLKQDKKYSLNPIIQNFLDCWASEVQHILSRLLAIILIGKMMVRRDSANKTFRYAA